MSKCPICLEENSDPPEDVEVECIACFNGAVRGINGTFTQDQRLEEHRRRSKWMQA